jgi:hypothetical protein
MGCFTRDYIRVADEQGMPQDLICLPSMQPEDIISSKKKQDEKSTEVIVKSQEKRMIR